MGVSPSYIATALHPALFQVSSTPSTSAALMEAHSLDGPFPFVVDALLKMGAKASRVMALVSIHLSGLLVSCPAVAEKYLSQMKALLLHGATTQMDANSFGVEGKADVFSLAGRRGLLDRAGF